MRFVFTFVLKDIERLCMRSNPERPEVGSALTVEDTILWHSLGFSTTLQWETGGCEQHWSILLEQVNQADRLLSFTLYRMYSHTPTFVGPAEAGEETWNHWNYSCVDNEKSLQMVGWINNLCEQTFFSRTRYTRCSAGWILQAS